MKQANDAESQRLATRDVSHLLERLSPGGAASSLAGETTDCASNVCG